jgi:hypothetical protein
MAVKHEKGFLPPQVKVPMDAYLGPNVANVNAGIERTYGLRTTVLRLVAALPGYHCIELEMHGKDSRRLRAVWVGPEDYARIRGPRKGYDPLAEWLDERARGEVPPQRPPWELSGWFQRARHWVDIQLDRLNIQATGNVIQTRALSFESTVMRVPTSVGNVYFKASSGRAPREAPLTRFMVAHWPENVTEPLAYDDPNDWMLMPDYATAVQAIAPAESFAAAAAALGRIQAESAGRLAELRQLGCDVLGLAGLRQFLLDGSLSNVTSALDAGDRSEELEKDLASLAPKLVDFCEQLEQYGIPDTVIHPDFRASNFFADTQSQRIIDWQNSCVGHPFFSVLELGRYDYDFALDAVGPDPVLRAYLQPFREFESEERLQQAMRLAHRLHYAWRLWYRMRALPYIEPNSALLSGAKRFALSIARNLLQAHRESRT